MPGASDGQDRTLPIIGRRKSVRRRRELLRQIFPHPDLLSALTRKKKSNRFRHGPRMNCKRRRFNPKKWPT